MARILVTGGCGYIGSHTLVDLIENGYEVISADNYSRSEERMFDGVEAITGQRVENIEVDLASDDAVQVLMSKAGDIDGIIHFAAYKSVPESVRHPLRYYSNNLNSTANMLEFARLKRVRNFVFSSSCTVYGSPEVLPVTEESPAGQIESPYGMTKVIGEQMIRDVIKSGQELQACLLRYFNPVGAHPSALIGELPIDVPNNLVPYITQTAVGVRDLLTVFGGDYETRDGSCIRDFIHVSDIAHAHTLALQFMEHNSGVRCDVFNLGTGNGVTVLEAVKAFEAVNDISLNYVVGPRRDGDIAAVYADNSKAIRELGWEVRYDLKEMMKSALAWERRLRAT